MHSMWQKASIKVPVQYQSEFRQEILKDNMTRLSILSPALFLTEIVMFFLRDYLFHTGDIILAFLGSNIVLVPLIWYAYKNITSIPAVFAKIVQLAYTLSALSFGVALTLATQSASDLVFIYFMTALGATTILYMRPTECFLLLFTVYMAFILLLPAYQVNADVVFITRINSLIFNLFVWILARMLLKMKLNLFLDKKMIRDKNRKLEDMVQRDAMTGLLNHKTSFEKLQVEILSADKFGDPLAVILADIDKFKRINDQFGHQVGDRILVKTAEILLDCVRSTDLVGRYGGEEFMIIMPNTQLEAARMILERIRTSLGSADFGLGITVTLSGGISQYVNESLEELIRIIDRKLYKAKNDGRDRFENAG